MNLLKYSLVASPQMQAKKAGDTHWSIAISKQRINNLHIKQKAAIAKAIATGPIIITKSRPVKKSTIQPTIHNPEASGPVRVNCKLFNIPFVNSKI